MKNGCAAASRRHLLVAISPHGFGHLAQVAPVLAALRRRMPLRLTLRTTLPEGVLAARIGGGFELQAAADDFGMVMTSALDVDAAASVRAYRDYHQDWDKRVEAVAAQLTAAAPDLVLADVPYLTLAAAARAGIPSVALCSLNWADIFRQYCGAEPGADRILGHMKEAYGSAMTFLRPAPSMPMADLANTRAIGPVAGRGRNRRRELGARLGLSDGEQLVLVAMGGVAFRPAVEGWPHIPGLRWVVQADWRVCRPDALVLESLGMPFADVLASCDVLFTKPGYGSFTEAAASGVPVLYVSRDGWPEEPFLVSWLEAHGRCARLSRSEMDGGRFQARLEKLLRGGRYAPVEPVGIGQAADHLEALLLSPQRSPGA